jgi:hypothetical protein
MMKLLSGRTWVPALFLAPIVFGTQNAAIPEPQGSKGHQRELAATVTLLDGSTKAARIEGLGCTNSICSRVAIKGRAADGSLVSFWLDGIAAIRDTHANGALLVLKDGTEQRISLVTDFRVLYLANPARGAERLDLTRIKSLEFLASNR